MSSLLTTLIGDADSTSGRAKREPVTMIPGPDSASEVSPPPMSCPPSWANAGAANAEAVTIAVVRHSALFNEVFMAEFSPKGVWFLELEVSLQGTQEATNARVAQFHPTILPKLTRMANSYAGVLSM